MASGGLGTHDALGRDVHQPQRLLRHDVHIGEDVVQHREIGRLPPGHIGPIGTLARTLGAAVIFYHKQNSFCFFSKRRGILSSKG